MSSSLSPEKATWFLGMVSMSASILRGGQDSAPLHHVWPVEVEKRAVTGAAVSPGACGCYL